MDYYEHPTVTLSMMFAIAAGTLRNSHQAGTRGRCGWDEIAKAADVGIGGSASTAAA